MKLLFILLFGILFSNFSFSGNFISTHTLGEFCIKYIPRLPIYKEKVMLREQELKGRSISIFDGNEDKEVVYYKKIVSKWTNADPLIFTVSKNYIIYAGHLPLSDFIAIRFGFFEEPDECCAIDECSKDLNNLKSYYSDSKTYIVDQYNRPEITNIISSRFDLSYLSGTILDNSTGVPPLQRGSTPIQDACKDTDIYFDADTMMLQIKNKEGILLHEANLSDGED